MWPVWIGIFYSIFELKVGLYITPLFALLAILSVFFAGKTLFNRNVGLTASLLLTLNFAQVWYARYPTSEVFTQFLVFSGIFTFIIFNRTSSKFFGIASALCFGETLLTRIDAVFLIIPIALFFGYLRLHDKLRKEHLYFIAPFLILSIHALITATFISTPYTFDIFRDISYEVLTIVTTRTYLAAILFALFVVGLALIDLNKNKIVKKTEGMNKYSPHAQHIIAVSIVILAVYAYFIRPGPPLIDSDRFNMIKLSWYLTELGVALAIIGLIIMIYRNPSKDVFLFFGIISIYGLYYINNAHITPDHPWWIRRYLPVVVPSFLISAGVALDRIKSSSFLGKGTSFILIFILIISFVQADKPIIGYVEHKGVIDQTRDISTFTGDDGRIIFTRNEYRGFHDCCTSTPLYFIYNREALWVRNNPAYYTKLIEKLKEWENSGKEILIANPTEKLLYELSKNFKLTAEKFPFNYRQLAQHPSYYQVNLSGKKYPLSYRMKPLTIPPLRTYNLTVYRLEEMKNVDQLLINMGANGTGYIKGFYGREGSQENVTFRWTRENARVNAPGLGNDSPLLMELRSPNWRPNRFPANISFSANGHEVQNYTLISEDRFKLYRLIIPQNFLNERYLEIKIHTDTWNPSKTMNSTDNRNLGIAVDWISLENLEN